MFREALNSVVNTAINFRKKLSFNSLTEFERALKTNRKEDKKDYVFRIET